MWGKGKYTGGYRLQTTAMRGEGKRQDTEEGSAFKNRAIDARKSGSSRDNGAVARSIFICDTLCIVRF
jgi:hypothetical protein